MELSHGGFLNPDKIIENLEIAAPGMKIADFGCGAGYFSLPLARMVRPGGEVFAIDVLDTALQAVKSRSRSEGLFNITGIKGDLESAGGSQLHDESQDAVLVANTLFQVTNKENVFKEVWRVLKHAGNLVFIDWSPDTPIGPPLGLKVDKEEIRQLAERNRFTFEKELAVDEFHYGLLFSK